MSAQNGDRARSQKDRKRKLKRRERLQASLVALRKRLHGQESSRAASLKVNDKGGPARIGG
jgi:hypothetical protein